jgi:iron complex outermembrane receptor protein
MRRYLSNQCASGVALAIAATSFSPVALSQTESAVLEEVLVTARKREESLAETPLAITAISAEEIKAANFKNIVDVQKTSPGLFMETMNNENGRTVLMPRFRGVTYDATSPLQRTSSVFVDGLVVSSGLHSLPITQVERIEVIKGPQSALFGRNTYSGAINIVTARPGEELKGSVEVDFGSRSKASANGFIEGPISDTIGARLTWSYVDKEGHYNNSFVDGQRLGDEKSTAVGVMFDINPSDSLNIMVRASQYEDDDGPGAYAVVGGLAEHNFCAEPTPAINSFSCFFVNGLESVYRGPVNIPNSLGASTSSTIFGFATDQLRGADGRWAGADGGAGYAPIGDHSFDDLSHNGFGKFGTGDRLGIIVSYDISDSMNFDMRYGSNKDDYVLFHDFDATSGLNPPGNVPSL